MVTPKEAHHGDIVQEAGKHAFFIDASLQREIGALQKVTCGGGVIKPELEEIEKRWRRRHFGQSGVIAHHHLALPALIRRESLEAGMVFRRAHGRERRFDHDSFRNLLRFRCQFIRGRRSGLVSVVHPASPFRQSMRLPCK